MRPGLAVGDADSSRHLATLDLTSSDVEYLPLIGYAAARSGPSLYRLVHTPAVGTSLKVVRGVDEQVLRVYGDADPRGVAAVEAEGGDVVFVVNLVRGADHVDVLHVRESGGEAEMLGSLTLDGALTRVDAVTCEGKAFLSGVIDAEPARSVLLSHNDGEVEFTFLDDGHSALLTDQGDGTIEVLTQRMEGGRVLRRSHQIACG